MSVNSSPFSARTTQAKAATLPRVKFGNAAPADASIKLAPSQDSVTIRIQQASPASTTETPKALLQKLGLTASVATKKDHADLLGLMTAQMKDTSKDVFDMGMTNLGNLPEAEQKKFIHQLIKHDPTMQGIIKQLPEGTNVEHFVQNEVIPTVKELLNSPVQRQKILDSMSGPKYEKEAQSQFGYILDKKLADPKSTVHIVRNKTGKAVDMVAVTPMHSRMLTQLQSDATIIDPKHAFITHLKINKTPPEAKERSAALMKLATDSARAKEYTHLWVNGYDMNPLEHFTNAAKSGLAHLETRFAESPGINQDTMKHLMKEFNATPSNPLAWIKL